jgi:hypothetical protein
MPHDSTKPRERKKFRFRNMRKTSMPERIDDDPPKQPLAGARCLVLDDDLLIALDIEHVLQTVGDKRRQCRRRDGGAA